MDIILLLSQIFTRTTESRRHTLVPTRDGGLQQFLECPFI